MTKDGSGTLTLSGSNTYTGGTTVTAGTLVAADVAALPGGGAFNVAGGATLVLEGDGMASRMMDLDAGPIASARDACLLSLASDRKSRRFFRK